jgi:hypothetical protein
VRTPAALAGVLGCPLPDPLPGLPPGADLPPAGAGLYVEAATPAGVAGAVAALLPGTR